MITWPVGILKYPFILFEMTDIEFQFETRWELSWMAVISAGTVVQCETMEAACNFSSLSNILPDVMTVIIGQRYKLGEILLKGSSS